MELRDFDKQKVERKLFYTTRTPEPKPVSEEVKKTNSARLKSYRNLIIVLLLVVLGVLAQQSYAYYQNRQLANQFPEKIRKDVNFPVFYPTELPSEFKLKTDSYSFGGGVVSVVITTPGGDLFITQQPKPIGLNLASFQESALTDVKRFHTALGEASIGTFANRTTASLVTSETWLTITSTGIINVQDLQLILQNLARAN